MSIELTTATPSILQDIRIALNIGTIFELFPGARFVLAGSSLAAIYPRLGSVTAINLAPFSFVSFFGGVLVDHGATNISGAEYLVDLENAGTSAALQIQNNNFSTSTLNTLFSALPVTTKTATINVADNPGAATCTPSIATNKGYIVITS